MGMRYGVFYDGFFQVVKKDGEEVYRDYSPSTSVTMNAAAPTQGAPAADR